MYYDVDNWGDANAATWAPDISDSWGTGLPYGYTNKNSNAFAWVANSFIINSLSALSQGPGRYNNPGELLVGKNVLSADEEST